MFPRIIYILLIASLSGCVVPVSSSCMDSQKYENSNVNYPPNNSKCSATDAAAYVIAATLKSMADEDNKTQVSTKEPVKCSDMVGKAQKECTRKERELYDPLDEL